MDLDFYVRVRTCKKRVTEKTAFTRAKCLVRKVIISPIYRRGPTTALEFPHLVKNTSIYTTKINCMLHYHHRDKKCNKSTRNVYILFQFRVVDLPLDINGDCRRDFIKIYEGTASWAPLKQTFCGKDPVKIISSENKLKIRFISDPAGGSYKGFKAIYGPYPDNTGKYLSSWNSY